jgi:hypothetical protein
MESWGLNVLPHANYHIQILKYVVNTKPRTNQLAVGVAVTVGNNYAVRFILAETFSKTNHRYQGSGLPDRVMPSAWNIKAHKATNTMHD